MAFLSNTLNTWSLLYNGFAFRNMLPRKLRKLKM